MQLQTSRLLLREFTLSDIKHMHSLESDPAVVRYQLYGPHKMADSERDVKTIMENASVVPRKHVELAVFLSPQNLEQGLNSQHDDRPSRNGDENDGQEVFLGRTGCSIRIDSDTPSGTADFWFSFLPSFQGKGYATEAMRAFIEHVVEASKEKRVLSFTKLEIECDPRNQGSVKLAARLGLDKEKFEEKRFEAKGEWCDSVTYSKMV